MMTNQLPPFFKHTPPQSLGGHWHLAGSLELVETHGNSELILVRKIDALSPQISVAKTCQYVIPKLTITTPSGVQVYLQNAKVTVQTQTSPGGGSTNELEEVQLTFQTITYTSMQGGISGADSWVAGSGGHKHKK
jgi:type VI protein secretion system component Hcp